MVTAGHPAGEPGIGTVSFLQSKDPHPIGAKDPNFDKCVGHQTNELDGYKPGARFVFTKTQSIDVVIEALQQAKDFMINKTDLELLRK